METGHFHLSLEIEINEISELIRSNKISLAETNGHLATRRREGSVNLIIMNEWAESIEELCHMSRKSGV